MSTDPPEAMRAHRAFRTVFLVTVVGLILAAVVAGALSIAQGPRVTQVLADAAAASTTSGTRVIFTANVPLAEVEESQVTLEPSAPFTVETAGRNVGIRLSEILAPDTTYTVTVSAVEGVGGGPVSEFSTTLHTPREDLLLLERSPGGTDRIYRADRSGTEREVVFEHDRIEDFRSSPQGLVVATSDDAGAYSMTWVPTEGDVEEIRLPGTGKLSRLQASAAGDEFAYVWTSLGSDGEPLEARLFFGSTAEADGEPVLLDLGEADPRVIDFRMIPRSRAVLVVNGAQQLLLADRSIDAEPALLGTATWIDDVARTTPTALVRTAEGPVRVDLETGEFTPVDTAQDLGTPYSAEILDTDEVLRTYLEFDEERRLVQQSVAIDDAAGSTTSIADVAPEDALVQVCASPTGDRVAAAIAPDIENNPIDTHAMRIPERVETRVIDLVSDDSFTLPGFAISWCRVPAL